MTYHNPYPEPTLADCAKGNHDVAPIGRVGNRMMEQCGTCGQVDTRTMECYLCSEFKPPTREIVHTFVAPGPDPTEVYVMDCGHHLI